MEHQKSYKEGEGARREGGGEGDDEHLDLTSQRSSIHQRSTNHQLVSSSQRERPPKVMQNEGRGIENHGEEEGGRKIRQGDGGGAAHSCMHPYISLYTHTPFLSMRVWDRSGGERS